VGRSGTPPLPEAAGSLSGGGRFSVLDGGIAGKSLIVAAGEATLPPDLRRAGHDAEIAEYFHENLLINVHRVPLDIESQAGQERGF
jgi:hypothetical protein